MPGRWQAARETQSLSSRGIESIAGLCRKIWAPLIPSHRGVLSSLSPVSHPAKSFSEINGILSLPLRPCQTLRWGHQTILSADQHIHPWNCPESFRSFWNTVILADTLSLDNREWAGEVEVPVCWDQARPCLSVLFTGAGPHPAPATCP